jgi:hypothetical protein
VAQITDEALDPAELNDAIAVDAVLARKVVGWAPG